MCYSAIPLESCSDLSCHFTYTGVILTYIIIDKKVKRFCDRFVVVCFQGRDAVGAAAEVSPSNLQCSMWSTGTDAGPLCAAHSSIQALSHHHIQLCNTLPTKLYDQLQSRHTRRQMVRNLPAENERDTSLRKYSQIFQVVQTQRHKT